MVSSNSSKLKKNLYKILGCDKTSFLKPFEYDETYLAFGCWLYGE